MAGPVDPPGPGPSAGAEPTDDELLRRHLAGDRTAFGTLVGRHQDRLWAVALRTVGDREEAADALQDALLSAFRRADTFRGDAAVTTWLHRIVVNACLDRIRRRAARPTVPFPSEQQDPPEPRDRLADRDTALAVEEALARLPAEQRAALVLVDVGGWPVTEAADLLGIPVGTLKSRCARGRARLAGVLAPFRPGRNHPEDASVGPSGTSQRRVDRASPTTGQSTGGDAQ